MHCNGLLFANSDVVAVIQARRLLKVVWSGCYSVRILLTVAAVNVKSSLFFSLCRVSCRVLMRTKKQRGPTLVPDGTPQESGKKEDVAPFRHKT